MVYDSGCSTTTFNDKKWFKSLEPLPQPSSSLSSSGNITRSTYAGTVSFDTVLSNGTVVTIELGCSLYQPSSPCNLISSLNLVENGVLWDQVNHTLFLRNTGERLAEMRTDFKVPTIKAMPQHLKPSRTLLGPTLASIPYRVMHRRLMHAGKGVVEEVCKQAGITLTHKMIISARAA